MKKLLITLLFLVMSVNIANAFGDDIDIKNENGIYHIVLKGDKIKKKIKVYASNTLQTNREIHLQSGAKLTINGGYFDPSNEKTISYIVINSQTYEDPIMNENLLTNQFLRKNLAGFQKRFYILVESSKLFCLSFEIFL